MGYKLPLSVCIFLIILCLVHFCNGSDELLAGSFSRLTALPQEIYDNSVKTKSVRTRYECAALCIDVWGTHFVYSSSDNSCTAYLGFTHTHTSATLIPAAPQTYIYQSNYMIGLGLQPRKLGGGKQLNIFIGMVFPLDGDIIAWRYYCHTVLPVVASVWRPTGSQTYLYIGGNLLTPTAVGEHHHDVPVADQIPIQAGDVIGLHYRSSELTGYGGLGAQGAIPADATGYSPYCCGFASGTDMPQFIKNGFISHESLVAGSTTVVSAPSGNKMAALLAYTKQN